MSDVIEKVILVAEQRFPDQLGTKERPGPQRYIMHSFVASARDLNLAPNPECAASAYKALAYCIMHEVMIDNITNALLLRNGKVEIQEVLKATTSRLTKDMGLAIFTSLFSEKQVAYLREHEMKVPDDPSDLPLSAGEPPGSLFDCGGVLVRGIIDGNCVHKCYYTTRNLLATARKEIVGNKVSSYNITKDGRRYSQAPPNWSCGTDSLEMLRKTAVRNFIKYVAVPRD